MTVPCNNNVAFHSVHTELYYCFCYYYSYYYSELQCCLFKNCSLWGRLDIVCNNAAVLYEGDWNKTLNTNLVSFNCFLFSIAHFLCTAQMAYPSAMPFTTALFSQSNNCKKVIHLTISLPQPAWGTLQVVKSSKQNKHLHTKPVNTRKSWGWKSRFNSIMFQYAILQVLSSSVLAIILSLNVAQIHLNFPWDIASLDSCNGKGVIPRSFHIINCCL